VVDAAGGRWLLCEGGFVTSRFRWTSLLIHFEKEDKMSQTIAVANSSNIASFAYSPKRSVLTVEFKSGATWEYEEVPELIFEGMKAAESKGSYLAKRIRGYYHGRRIN